MRERPRYERGRIQPLSHTASPTYSCDLSKPIRLLKSTQPLSHTASLAQICLSCTDQTLSLQIGLSHHRLANKRQITWVHERQERSILRESPRCKRVQGVREAMCKRGSVQERGNQKSITNNYRSASLAQITWETLERPICVREADL